MLMQSEIAGMGRRLLATVLDFVILHLALTVVLRNMLLSPAGVWLVDFILIVVYSAIFLGITGQTPGKMLLGLRVIDAQGGGLDYGQTFRRAVVKWSPVFVLFIVIALLTPEELYQGPVDGEVMDTVEVEAQSVSGFINRNGDRHGGLAGVDLSGAPPPRWTGDPRPRGRDLCD